MFGIDLNNNVIKKGVENDSPSFIKTELPSKITEDDFLHGEYPYDDDELINAYNDVCSFLDKPIIKDDDEDYADLSCEISLTMVIKNLADEHSGEYGRVKCETFDVGSFVESLKALKANIFKEVQSKFDYILKEHME